MGKIQNGINSKWEIIGAPHGKVFLIFFCRNVPSDPFGQGQWMACDSAPKIKNKMGKIENGKNSRWEKLKNSHFSHFQKCEKPKTDKNGKFWVRFL